MNNEDQIAYWNGRGGERWVAQSDRLDAMLAPFAEAVIGKAALKPGERVMDVGCGAGALTLRAAAEVGAEKGALGVDVSTPLIRLARKRAEEAGLPARFEQADASAYKTDDKADIVISRFGVMFFEEPAAAFANIRHLVKPQGRLTFICWQGLKLNDWAFVPLKAGLPFLKEAPPPADPDAPGPFAFQDRDRLVRLLGEAGWSDVKADPLETTLTLPGDDLESSAKFMMQMGPLARLLTTQDIDPKPVEEAVRNLLRGYETPGGAIVMRAACWLVSGKNR